MSAGRQAITANGAPAAVGPYSHAVRTGDLLFLSGQTPLDPATGKLVEGSIGDQTRQCLENLQTVCAAAGTSLDKAVRCGIYVTDMSTFAQVNEVYATFFSDPQPARSTIGVASLPIGAQVEIDAVVALAD
ncbi:MAG TPA: Rid family detoxifying hydrolase [Baekduia sp.]|jgi:2-iminobutanoate/2-iminopropanoate deaminase